MLAESMVSVTERRGWRLEIGEQAHVGKRGGVKEKERKEKQRIQSNRGENEGFAQMRPGSPSVGRGGGGGGSSSSNSSSKEASVTGRGTRQPNEKPDNRSQRCAKHRQFRERTEVKPWKLCKAIESLTRPLWTKLPPRKQYKSILPTAPFFLSIAAC